MGEYAVTIIEFEEKVKQMINDLKTICSDYGLGNTGEEAKIITNLFMYKFLNDKLIHAIRKEEGGQSELAKNNPEQYIQEMDDEDYEGMIEFLGANVPKFKKEHYISNLYNMQNDTEIPFHKRFDNAMQDISDYNKDVYSFKTSTGKKRPLFTKMTDVINDSGKRLRFSQAIINRLAADNFEKMFEKGDKHDFFSTIFEHLIKDYNKDSGKYAEYYTPAFASRIIAEIMVHEDVKNVTAYDPAGGSGTLLMSIAHKIGEENCSIFAQELSQKSSDFLRLNLILNELVHSLSNVAQGNTLSEPSHKTGQGLKKHDYIVSNPPFNTDFSGIHESLVNDSYNRFFAGVPNIPKKKKDGMAIYQMFMQHILSSLKDDGKACIVVPSGFCTNASGIPLKIRQELLNNNHLRGVIHMPSHIFATTGTNVSLIFIDRDKKDDEVMFVDASNLGRKQKVDGYDKTVLSEEEENQIIDTFNKRKEEKEFSTLVSVEEVKENDYQISAGRYFDFEIEEMMTLDELQNKVGTLTTELNGLFVESQSLQVDIKKLFGGITYE